MDDPWGSPWTSTDRSTEGSFLSANALLPFKINLPLKAGDSILSLPAQSPWADEEDGFGDWAVADGSVATPLSCPVNQELPPDNLSVSKSSTPATTTISVHSNAELRSTCDTFVSDPATDHQDGNLNSANDGFHQTVEPLSESGDARLPERPVANDDEHVIIEVPTDHFTTEKIHDGGPPNDGNEPSLNLNNTGAVGENSLPKHEVAARCDTESGEQGRSRSSIDNHKIENQRGTDADTTPSNFEQVLLLETKALPNFEKLGQLQDVFPLETNKQYLKETTDERTGEAVTASGQLASVALDSCYKERLLPDGDSISSTAESVPECYISATANCITSAESPTGPGASTVDDHGSICFVIDQEKVNCLFGSEQASPRERETSIKESDTWDWRVSDHVITDSFSTIGERKTWYRISRKGSARKAGMEDEGNYRTVSWQGSVVRSETVKVVRRWMEEDSFTGKPVLGLSGTRGNLFGWDSTTEPVALNDVFKRVSPTSPRSSVAFSSIGDHLHMSPVAESSSHMCPSEKQGAATGFPTVHEAVNRGESPQNCSYMADASISVIAGAPSQNAGNDVSETVPSQCSGNQDIPSAREKDEWGEMVSPVEDTGEAVLEGALPPVSSRIEYWQDVGGENSMLSTRGSVFKRIGSPINDPAISLSKRNSYFFGFGRENVFANAISTDKPAGVACSPQLSNDKSFRSNEDLIQRIVYGLPDLSYMEK